MGNPSIFDVLCKVAFLTLLASPFQCDAASGKVRVDNVKVDILSKQGAVLETFQYQNEIPNIDVRGSAIVKVEFNVLGASGSVLEPDQVSVIVSKKQEGPGGQNVVSFASMKDGKMMATFDWSVWEGQFGSIGDRDTFEMSITVGNRSPPVSFQTTLASLAYLPGPKPTQIPGKVPVTTRIANVIASLSIMPEISHKFRPEEKMVAAPISVMFAAFMFVPVVLSVGLMIKSGANLRGYVESHGSVSFIANMFHLGIASIIAIQIAFWLKYNLMQILPILVPVELITLALGIKLSAMTSAAPTVSVSTDTAATASKKNL